jgi:hypothetical protein
LQGKNCYFITSDEKKNLSEVTGDIAWDVVYDQPYPEMLNWGDHEKV